MDPVKAIENGLPVIFFGAHPDDENLIGPLLAFAAECSSLTLVCLTRGESGWNLLPTDTTRTLAQIRFGEFEKACGVLNAPHYMLNYTNGTSKAHPEGLAIHEGEEASDQRWTGTMPREVDETPEAAIARWSAEAGDPVPLLEEHLQRIGPCLVITFDPVGGYTGHNEHRALSMLVSQAIQNHKVRGGEAVTLLQIIGPNHATGNEMEIRTDHLNKIGTRDYAKVTLDAVSQYASQWGIKGSDEYVKFTDWIIEITSVMRFNLV